MNDREKIIDKIKKCLRLSASSNEHEAEAALRQARKLMEAHGITVLDIQAAEAEERRAKSGAKNHPANWEAMLAAKIGKAFGCRIIFAKEFDHRNFDFVGRWVFIGCGVAPEIGQYAFEVLYRQAKRARAEHIKTKLNRCGPTSKVRRGDLFSEGWVHAVAGKIEVFAGTEQQTAAIDAYMGKHYPTLGNLKSRDRNDPSRRLSDREYDDYASGRRAGKDAELNRGVGGSSPLALE